MAPRIPPASRSLAAQEGTLLARRIRLKNQSGACRIYAQSNAKIEFVCTKQECLHDFDAAPSNIMAGRGCPYCSSVRLCGNEEEDCQTCLEKSLASKADELAARHLKYIGDQPARTIFINQNSKTKFVCLVSECQHDFDAAPANIMAGRGCPYCSSQKLCGPDEGCQKCLGKTVAARKTDLEARRIRFAGKDPAQVFACSGSKVPWQCLDLACGSKWTAAAFSVCNRSGCPDCARHMTERMVAGYVASVWGGGGALRADWCRDPTTGRHLPFDIYLEIDQRGIIFEVDGGQHFREVAFFNRGDRTYEKILERDRFKQTCALENGRHLVRLHQEDVLFGRIDWRAAIHEAVYKCLQSATPLLLCVADDASCYAKHTAPASSPVAPQAPALPSPGARCVKMEDFRSRLAAEDNLRWAEGGGGARADPFLAQTGWLGPPSAGGGGPPGYALGGGGGSGGAPGAARCAKPVYPDYFVKAYGTVPNETTKAVWW